MKDICDFIDKTKKYYIYGTASFGQYCCRKLTENFGDDIVVGFIETNPTAKSKYGKKIFSLEEADKNTEVIITGLRSGDVMRKNLKNAGFKENSITLPQWYQYYYTCGYDRQIKNVSFWPPIDTFNKDLTDKISWFIPDRITVNVWTDNKETIAAFKENVNICDINDADKIIENSDYIFIWDTTRDGDIGEKMKNNKIRVVDPNFHSILDIANYARIYNASYSEEEKNELKNHSLSVFENLVRDAYEYKRANVFCTGPSIHEINAEKYTDDFNIICNSMVKDKEMLDSLKPNIITFTDNAFYLSPNDYCQAFYKDLVFGYNTHKYYMVVYDYQVPILKKHFPELYDHLIGLEVLPADADIHFPSKDNLAVRTTKNICTQTMITIASVVSDTIGLAGCTGRNPDETYFWKHNEKTQYHDLMHYVFDAYPAFFRDTKYDDYYDEHCEQMKKIIEYGESLGKKYINLTTSFIPVLRERTETK